MKPQLEAPGLLGQSEERPGDVLLHAPPSLKQGVPHHFDRVALDFAVVSLFVARHGASDGPQQLQTATAYAETK